MTGRAPGRRVPRRLRRLALSVAVTVATLAAVYLVVIYAGAWVVGTGALLLSRGLVWVVVSMAEGVDLWTLVAQVGGGIGNALTTPAGAGALVALEVVAVLALFGLHRAVRGGRRPDETKETR